jgi:hypothetical protein
MNDETPCDPRGFILSHSFDVMTEITGDTIIKGIPLYAQEIMSSPFQSIHRWRMTVGAATKVGLIT